jgi:hypothetical protein
MPQEEENDMGDHDDLPTDKEECSREDCIRRASHWSSWTEVIEEIRKLMLRSAESSQQRGAEQRRACHSSREEEEEEEEQQQQQQHSWRGARGQLQGKSLGSRRISTLEKRSS